MELLIYQNYAIELYLWEWRIGDETKAFVSSLMANDTYLQAKHH